MSATEILPIIDVLIHKINENEKPLQGESWKVSQISGDHARLAS